MTTATPEVGATTVPALEVGADTVAVGVFDTEGVAHDLPGGELAARLRSGEGRTRHGHLALARAGATRVLLAGLGARERFDGEAARIAAAVVLRRARELGTRKLCWEVPHRVDDAAVAGLVEGTLLAGYRYAGAPVPVEEAGEHGAREGALEQLVLSAHHDIAAAVARAATITRAQNRARDLANRPPNDLTPARLAEHVIAASDATAGLAAEVLDGEAIRSLGMGALVAVARGSAEDPRVIVLRYDGAGSPDGAPLLGLIGKAITYDSGGLWLKPGGSQRTMKFDMAGGAAVIEAVRTLAELRAPVRVLGIVGAAENLPGPTATRAGDVVRALDGTTIQIDNTDAEGRLLLADCIAYAKRLGAERLVTIATLTGGVVAALGSVHAGLLASDDAVSAALQAAAMQTGELVWRLPLHPRYAEMVRGRYAQLVNHTERREAMAITAAEFLHHFAGDTPWGHLDIAGVADDAHLPYLDSGGSGFGVRLLVAAAERLAPGGHRPLAP